MSKIDTELLLDDRNIPDDQYDNYLDHLCLESMKSMAHYDDDEIFYNYLKATNKNDLLEFTASLEKNITCFDPEKISNNEARMKNDRDLTNSNQKERIEKSKRLSKLIKKHISNSNDSENLDSFRNECFSMITESNGQVLEDFELFAEPEISKVVDILKKWWQNKTISKKKD